MEIAIACFCLSIVLLAYLIIGDNKNPVKDIFTLFTVFLFLTLITNWVFCKIKYNDDIKKNLIFLKKEMEILKNSD
jgi:energy-coupling factor transporter transmembrane protein EcfT